jgi:hypothetical protein
VPAGDRPVIALRSPVTRAVVPVIGGIAVLSMMALVLWGIAAYLSGDGTEPSERLAPTTLEISSVESAAATVAESGPILLPGLNTTSGERTMVLHHEGVDPATGWRVFYAYPADREPACTIEQVRGTRRFVDCEARTIDVTELAPPPTGVNPVVEDGMLSLDLRGVTTG